MPPILPELPALSLPHMRVIQNRMAVATADLKRLMETENPQAADLRTLLEQGACFEEVSLSTSDKSGGTEDLWQRILDRERLDLFEILLDADAARPAPDHHEAHLISRVAAHGRPEFLDALLALNPPLNQKGHTPFLWKSRKWDTTQVSTGLIGALMGKNDRSLDRLLAAGADPRGALDPPVYLKRPEKPYAPLSLLHLARTPHAVRCLVEAGLDINVEDEIGRTTLELVFDHLQGLTPEKRETHLPEAVELVGALLDSGARPSGGARAAGMVTEWSAVVRAAQADLVPMMALLQDRGLCWPDGHSPASPSEALRIMGRGIPLPLAEQGNQWLVGWALDERFPWHLAEHTDALKPLAQQGMNLDAMDPKTGLIPLVACLRAGSYDALSALVEAGMDLKGYPGIWNEGLTWDRFLHITICLRVWGEVHEASEPPALWWKVPSELMSGTGASGLGPTLKRTLMELGNHPGVAAEIQRQRLETEVAPCAVVQGSRPRL